MGIYYEYITIRRKFGEKKIDLVVRWVFMMNYLLYAEEKMHTTHKNKHSFDEISECEWKIRILWRSTFSLFNFTYNKSFAFWNIFKFSWYKCDCHIRIHPSYRFCRVDFLRTQRNEMYPINTWYSWPIPNSKVFYKCVIWTKNIID